jgi:hypothetical protein
VGLAAEELPGEASEEESVGLPATGDVEEDEDGEALVPDPFPFSSFLHANVNRLRLSARATDKRIRKLPKRFQTFPNRNPLGKLKQLKIRSWSYEETFLLDIIFCQQA